MHVWMTKSKAAQHRREPMNGEFRRQVDGHLAFDLGAALRRRERVRRALLHRRRVAIETVARGSQHEGARAAVRQARAHQFFKGAQRPT